MAVSSLELRPRGSIALFDAAVRLTTTTSGVWALTLPTGAALVAAVFNLADAIQRHGRVALPVMWVTVAWLLRALSQGAACHYLEQQLLSAQEPSVRASWLVALRRAPSLFITSAHNFVLNVLLGLFTAGLGFLFVGAHSVAYAVTIRGEGTALSVYSTCAKLLGPAKHMAAWVRACGLVQLLVAINLHGGVAMLMFCCRSLLGFDVTFAERFTSLDNSTWTWTIVALTFALFEPIRAATATLLLIDGRVRQEGLDLVAAIEQLPRRKKSSLGAIGVAVSMMLLLSSNAFAQSNREKLIGVAEACNAPLTKTQIQDIEALPPAEDGAMTRFANRLEVLALDDDDCENAVTEMNDGLKQIHEARRVYDAQQGATAKESAQQILSRPEFQNVEPVEEAADQPEGDEAPGWFQKAWDSFWQAIIDWLKNFKPDPPKRDMPDPTLPTSSPEFAADLVIIGAIVLVLIVLGVILWKFRERRPVAAIEGESSSIQMTELTSDPMSALSRPAETWAGQADELARQGNFREAIRHLYLALLSRLHRDGVIDYDPNFSNWDYLSRFKGPGDSKHRFRDLTLRFDFAWYGNLEVHQVAWSAFRGIAEPLLTTGETPHA